MENESRFVFISLHAKSFFFCSMFISVLNACQGNCLSLVKNKTLVQLFSVIWGRLENLMSVCPAVLTCLCLWTAAEGLCTSRHSTPLTQATHIILLCLFRTLHIWSSLSCPSYNSPLPLTPTGQVQPGKCHEQVWEMVFITSYKCVILLPLVLSIYHSF